MRKIWFQNKYFMIMTVLIAISIICLIASASYAFFVTSATSKDYVIYTGNLKVDYEKSTPVIHLENAYPMNNQEGLQQIPHEFTVTNHGNVSARYQIRLEIDDHLKNMVPLKYIKLSYQSDGSDSTPKLLSDLNSSLVFLKNVIIKPGEEHQYGIKLWIDISAPNEIQGKEFKARIVVDSIQDVEDGYVVDTAPIITLKKDEQGNQDIHLKVGDDYKELGVEKVEDDQEIFTIDDVTTTIEYYNGIDEGLTEVKEINTNKTGIYYITYQVTDESDNIGQATRIVTVNQTDTIPDIDLKGESMITIEAMDNFVDPGVEVEEGNKVVTIGEVKTSVIGNYTLRYIVIDKDGNLNSIVRTVHVIEKNIVVTFNFNIPKNYSITPDFTATKNNFKGLVNDVINIPGFYTKDFKEGDQVIFSLDIDYSDLTANEEEDYGFYLQCCGNLTGWGSYELGGGTNRNLETGVVHVDRHQTLTNGYLVENTRYSCHLRTNYYTGGTLTIKNYSIMREHVEKMNLLSGHLFGTLPKEEIEGYTFLGWYTESEGGTQITENDFTPNINTTYYAHWSEVINN